jgi:hypothetical protein
MNRVVLHEVHINLVYTIDEIKVKYAMKIDGSIRTISKTNAIHSRNMIDLFTQTIER